MEYAPEVAELEKLIRPGMLDGEVDIRIDEIIKKAREEAEEIIRKEETDNPA